MTLCKESSSCIDPAQGLSTQQLSSKYFGLIKTIGSRDEELNRLHGDVERLKQETEDQIKALQEALGQQRNMEQRKKLTYDKLCVLKREKQDLVERQKEIRSCFCDKKKAAEQTLCEIKESIRRLMKENEQSEKCLEREEEKQRTLCEKVTCTRDEMEDMQNKIMKTECKICKTKQKSNELNKQTCALLHQNTVMDTALKASVDKHNELMKELNELEKQAREIERETCAARTQSARISQTIEEKECQLTNARSSKFQTISDLYLLNDSLQQLACSNKEKSNKIEENQKVIVHWDDKIFRNTDALADVINNRNKCVLCGSPVECSS